MTVTSSIKTATQNYMELEKTKKMILKYYNNIVTKPKDIKIFTLTIKYSKYLFSKKHELQKHIE